ncbi:MAG: ribbon-helix-helix protein, CopG family [Nitrospirae bacterium]|nr:ribbon-helix-helix protein, CopG family [Nitrospirota bacterium]
MPLISIRLEDNQDKRLIEMMKRSGASKSECIKTILRKYFNQNQILLPATKAIENAEQLTQKVRAREAAQAREKSKQKLDPIIGDPFPDPFEARKNYHRNEFARLITDPPSNDIDNTDRLRHPKNSDRIV